MTPRDTANAATTRRCKMMWRHEPHEVYDSHEGVYYQCNGEWPIAEPDAARDRAEDAGQGVTDTEVVDGSPWISHTISQIGTPALHEWNDWLVSLIVCAVLL